MRIHTLPSISLSLAAAVAHELAASRAAQVALVTDALGDWTPTERDDLARILGRLNDALVAARPARPPHDAAHAAPAPSTTGDPA